MVFGMIVAGGSGSRMGNEIPKQFLKLREKPIIVFSTQVFLDCKSIDQVILLVPEEWLGYTEELVQEYIGDYMDDSKGVNESRFDADDAPKRFRKRLHIITGGETRNDTIMKGIKYIKDAFPECEDSIIVSHDGARPFVTEEIIQKNIDALTYGEIGNNENNADDNSFVACDTVVAATDTIVESPDGKWISSVPDRNHLYHSQTPQTFFMDSFESAYLSLSEDERLLMTDVAKIFNRVNKRVALVEGDPTNIKITYPHDLKIAEALLD